MHGRLERELENKGIPYRTDVSAAALCTFRIGGTAALLIEPQCPRELADALWLCRRYEREVAVIGGGSNLLFADGRIETVLLRTVGLDHFSLQGGVLSAQCGCRLAVLARAVAEAEYGDLAFAAGIPGTLGGAICMNAGAHGGEIGALVESAELLFWETGEIRTVFTDELNFSYRNSLLQNQKCFLIRAALRLKDKKNTTDIVLQMNEYLQKRRDTQPLHLPSAGSTFRRPDPQIAVGRLLDELGLKGVRQNGAAVSEKHGGFIVNCGGATAADVLFLMEKIQKIAERERGIMLVPEVTLIR